MNKHDLGNILLIATHNDGKVREITELLAPTGLNVTSAKAEGLSDVEETGDNFEANAQLKALAACEASGLPALSDDSGLCVNVLNGAPGIYSARWAGASKDFNAAMQRIEDQLVETGTQDRTAYFVCVLCLALPDGRVKTWRGEIHGELTWPPRGTMGFGYDPMFIPQGFTKTFGEISAQEKHGWHKDQNDALSHRARAFKAFYSDIFAKEK